ncbi:MAG: hypothetical protein ABIT96_09735 [Ferruginibacter sp.]
MPASNMVRLIPYSEIDKTKWDECIRKSQNALIYGYSYALDCLAMNWDGIVEGEYDAVMPVTWKRKYGIRYLYQPMFLQQGGIFSPSIISEATTRAVYKLLIKHFQFCEIHLNYKSPVIKMENIKQEPRQNFILPLNKNHDEISSRFSKNAAAELRRLQKFHLGYEVSHDYNSAINLYQKLYFEKMAGVRKDDFTRFKKLCDFLAPKNQVVVRKVLDERGEILCIGMLLRDDNRLYNIISALQPAGKKVNANYFLLDSLISEFSGQPLILDFEGSDNKGIKYFYQKFGALAQPYNFMHFNRLPFFLKWFKK